MIDVYILRHGEPAPRKPGSFVGQTDIPLSETGRAQAREWRAPFSRIPFALAVSSDLARCVQTADQALEGHPVERRQDARLRELNLGAWQGLTPDEVKARFPGQYEARGARIASFAPPGGESFKQVSRRVREALYDHAVQALERGGPLLLVAHLGVARCAACHALGMPLSGLLRIEQTYARCLILRFDGKFREVAGINLPASALDADSTAIP